MITQSQGDVNSIPPEKLDSQLDKESLRIALHEMRALLQQRFEAADALDRKADALLGTASLVLTLVSTLQLALLGPGTSWLYWLGLVSAFVLYLALIALVSSTLMPESYTTPIQARWEVLDEYLFQRREEDALLTLISGYVEQITANRQILERRVARIRIAWRLLPAIVVILFLLSLMPR